MSCDCAGQAQQPQPSQKSQPPKSEPASPSKSDDSSQRAKGDESPQPKQKPAGKQQPYTDVPNSQIRKIIAQRLLESKQKVPHLYVRADADIGKLTEMRTSLKEQGTKVRLACHAINKSIGPGGCSHCHAVAQATTLRPFLAVGAEGRKYLEGLPVLKSILAEDSSPC